MIKHCLPDGPEDAQVVILTDRPGYGDLNDGRLLSDHAGRILWDSFRSGAGLTRARFRVESICLNDTHGAELYELDAATRTRCESDCLDRLSRLNPRLFVALGDGPLGFLTGLHSSDKNHLSILPGLRPGSPKVLSLLHPERVFKEVSSAFYLKLGAQKILRESTYPEIRRPHREYKLHPTLREIALYCLQAAKASWLSVDIETALGQITCVGFASAPHSGICIPARLEDWPDEGAFHTVWSYIAQALAGPSKKVFQNGIYDLSYFSAYGLRVSNFAYDTMIAQRTLYPELSVGLDNIARIYTDEPYWKDDAKDWNARQDRESLYRYNVTDACVTLAASIAQRVELRRRGLEQYFSRLMCRASTATLEMSWRGLPLAAPERDRLRTAGEQRSGALEAELNQQSGQLLGRPTNPRSPVQVKELLAAAGFKRLPHLNGKETSNIGALMKLRLRRPDSTLLTALIDISGVNKELSSYLNVETSEGPSPHVRYTLYSPGTETHRDSCSKDPWDRGLNAQTLPAHLRSMFVPPPDHLLVEVDLAQADARVVAWDAAEPTLMEFFNSRRDIHRYVASQPELFSCSPDSVTGEQRQLGKKVGHAANYGVGAATLAESCLKEMNLVISEQRAERMLQGYLRTFPGIPRWQERLRSELSRTRSITAPTGYTRQFMGRFGPPLFREAYAHLPQHLVAYAINQLILALSGKVELRLQIHDSVLFTCSQAQFDNLLPMIQAQDWNPTYKLAGGDLRIPIEIKTSALNWGSMTKLWAG